MLEPASPINEQPQKLKNTFTRFFIAVVFGIAFGYIEAAVVVYLRAIFYPDGFNFPLSMTNSNPSWNRLLFTETGREVATIVLITTGAILFGKNLRQRIAYFLIIFAAWDIFYYIWLKLLLDWPASIMDWDILFLIPMPWAGPVLAPVIISVAMLLLAGIILYHDCNNKTIVLTLLDKSVLILATIVIIGSFCVAGLHSNTENYKDYFYWMLFAAGLLPTVVLFIRRVKTKQKKTVLPD
jgi:hypothetical protein